MKLNSKRNKLRTINTNKWPIKPLGELLYSLESGRRPKGGSINNGIPSIGAEHLHESGQLNFNSIKYIPPNFYNSMRNGKILKRDILIVKDGATTGKVSFVNDNFPFENAAVNEHVFILRPNKELLDARYTFYYLYSINGQKQIHSDFRGSAQGGISRGFIGKIFIPLPPINIQREIAEYLDKVTNAIQNRKKAIKLTDQFLKSAFVEIFGDPLNNPKGWQTGIIKNAVQYSEYGTSKKSNKEKLGVPILGMSNLNSSGELDLTKLNYVELSENEFNKLKLTKGDVIFNRTNSTELIGKTAYWDRNIDAVLASYLIKLTMNSKVDPIWFSNLLNTKYYKSLFALKCKKAVNQSNISPTLLKEFPMYFPPKELQMQYAEIFKQIRLLKDKQNKSEIELDNLFNNLMQKAFNGELF